MSRNGSGTYTPPTNSWSPAINGTLALTSDWQALLNDIVAALTQSVSKDGQTVMTGSLNMGGFNLTNVASAAIAALTGSPTIDAPTLTGIPVAPTAAGGTNTTQIATTAYVQGELGGFAPINSPNFTGTPTAPTATVGTNTDQLATTAFVNATALSSALPGQTGNARKFVTTDGTNASWSFIYGTPSVIGTNTNATSGTCYVFTASLTLTLPATPTPGDFVAFQNSSGVATCVIGRNGSNIMSLAQDMTVDTLYAPFVLIYADATRGWVFI